MIGATYSTSDYQYYKQTGDQNHFEEVIDKLMLDKYSEEPELKDYIKSLSLYKKRMAILSLLGGDNNLWVKIKALTDKNISKMDHIKDVILMLREYVKVGEVEKKKFGEVMTPLELVKEMLATLPEEVWSNPNLKWLDPANGTGPYPVMVIYKLMNGLKDWEPDAEKRYKHIVENMIYVCELQPKNMFLYMCAVDPFDTYKLNIYTGSFLEEGFDYHMKEVWGVDKFDIVVGNPPYNDGITNSGTSSDIYDKFIFKSDLLSDKVLMITPSRWFNKPDKKKLRELMIKKGRLASIKTDNVSFDNLNIRGGVSYFIMNKKNNKTVSFNGVDINLRYQLDNFGFILMNQNDSKLVESILNKTNKIVKLSTIFNSQSYFGLKTNHKEISNMGNKCYFSSRQKNSLDLSLDDTNNRYYSYVKRFNDRDSLLNKYKLITPSAYGYKTSTENTYNKIGETFIGEPGDICTESFIFFAFDSYEECYNLSKYLETNFIKYLISLKKIKQHVTSKVFELVPKLDFTKEWTDEMLYEYFNLTQEEIDLIE